MSALNKPSQISQSRRNSEDLGPLADFSYRSPMPTIFVNSLHNGSPIAFSNDAFLAMMGFTRDDILNQPIMALFGDTADPITIGLLQTTLASGGIGYWQINFQRANKSTFFGVIYVAPVWDEDRALIGHVVNAVDLAAMLCISRETKSIYPQIYDKAPGFIAMSRGENHTFTYANASYLDFVKRDDIVGKTVAEAIPEVVDQGILATLDEVYRTGIPFYQKDMPVNIWNPELGRLEERWTDVVYQPVRDDSGAIIGLFCEGYDVTEIHETNAALAALQTQMLHVSRVNAMGTMATTMAHELNQPLTAIANYLAWVKQIEGEEPDVKRLLMALEGIKEASTRASGLINQLRQLTKHRQPSREPFALREAIDECVRLVRSTCRAEIRFDNRVPADLNMTADRVKMQQVLINLLQNACDAMAKTDPAVITFDAVQEDRAITISVADTGPGVPAEAQATIFSWTDSSKDTGMGIGLSICRTIIDLYRGNIWLESSGPQGTEFRFSIPLAEQSAPEDASRATWLH